MSILTLDVGGANEMEVRVSTAGHAEPKEVGARRYAFFGNERSMLKAELMVVPVVLYDATPADVRVIRALFARGGQVVCNGLVFNNGLADITCSGEITDEMVVGDVNGEWVTTLTLTEIAP